MKKLFISCKDYDGVCHNVGVLTFENNLYKFQYTKGAKIYGHISWMRDLNMCYVSEKLFPFFANKIMNKSRPDYAAYIDCLGINDINPMNILANCGGNDSLDKFYIYHVEEVSEISEINFFVLNYNFKELNVGDLLSINNSNIFFNNELIGNCSSHLLRFFNNPVINVIRINKLSPVYFTILCKAKFKSIKFEDQEIL